MAARVKLKLVLARKTASTKTGSYELAFANIKPLLPSPEVLEEPTKLAGLGIAEVLSKSSDVEEPSFSILPPGICNFEESSGSSESSSSSSTNPSY
eukprot:8123236-Karenia_brevis.AAC.1